MLTLSDVTAVSLLVALRAITQSSLLGDTALGQLFATHFPSGFLGGWQFVTALVLAMFFAGTYWAGPKRPDPEKLGVAVALATALVLWDDIWTIGFLEVATRFLATVAAVWMVVYLLRHVLEWAAREYRSRRSRPDRTLFVGQRFDAHAGEIQAMFERGGARSLGWVGTEAGRMGRRLNTPDDVWPILEELQPDIVVVVGRLPDSFYHDVIEAAAAAGSRTLLTHVDEAQGTLETTFVRMHGSTFIEVRVPALRTDHLLMKRVLDIVSASLALLVLSPLLLLIGALIRLDSPGAPIFTQDRVGLGGRIFRVFKFRTMRRGADGDKKRLLHLNHTGDPRFFKIPNDPRVTRFGELLRRWSLDELPQLLNVILGDMSLVGPRPFPESDFEGYQEHHYGRLAVKPGITGLWQVKGRSQIVDFEEVVRLDRQYIEGWSFWLDLRIILLTLPAVMRRSGAY